MILSNLYLGNRAEMTRGVYNIFSIVSEIENSTKDYIKKERLHMY